MAATFDLKPVKGGNTFRFNLKAPNGEVILTSAVYNEKPSALTGIESVKQNAPSDQCYERKKSKKNEPYFVLKTTTGEILGTSEMYTSVKACDAGIAAVKKHGPAAALRDNT